MSNKNKNKTRKNHTPHIQHHHLLLRLETVDCPLKDDMERMKNKINKIVKDIEMKPLSKVQTYYMETPKFNQGMTGLVVIQTSHLTFHFWKNPDSSILHNPHSKCLLQADIYTCSKLSGHQIATVLKELEDYKITHADINLLNRKKTLHMDLVETWDMADKEPWLDWIKRRF